MAKLVQLAKGTSTLGINSKNGHLCNLVVDEMEFMHGASKPEKMRDELDVLGWGSSEIEMGTVANAVKTGIVEFYNGQEWIEAEHDQHGLLRLIKPEVKQKGDTVIVTKTYEAGTRLPNPKYDPTKPTKRPKDIWAPQSFTYTKTYRFIDELTIEVNMNMRNDGDADMYFMLGYHPAFRLSRKGEHKFMTKGETFNLEDIWNSATRFYESSSARYEGQDRTVSIGSSFANTWLWSPNDSTHKKDPVMFCMEPCTHIPDTEQTDLEGNLVNLRIGPEPDKHGKPYEKLSPGESKDYRILIRVEKR